MAAAAHRLIGDAGLAKEFDVALHVAHVAGGVSQHLLTVLLGVTLRYLSDWQNGG